MNRFPALSSLIAGFSLVTFGVGCAVGSEKSDSGTLVKPAVRAGDDSLHENPSARRDSQAIDALRNMARFLGAQKGFSLTIDSVQDEHLERGQHILLGRRVQLALLRPARFRAHVVGDIRNADVFYNGETVAFHDPDAQTHAMVPAATTIDETLDLLAERYGYSLPLADLFFSDPFAVLTESLLEARHLGVRRVDGRTCEHLAFRQPEVDWQIWIDTGPQPLPCRFAIRYRNEPDSPQFVANLSNWNFVAPRNDSQFTFVAPETSELVELVPLESTATLADASSQEERK